MIEFKKSKSYSEEESEFDVDESDEEMAVAGRKKPIAPISGRFYYSDLGYAESTRAERKFVNVPVSTTPDPNEAPINTDYLGRIIDISDDENNEYGRSCQCDFSDKEMLFTRRRRESNNS